MKVWDLPIRLFHWLIVLLVGFSWWSAEAGVMDWHYRSGLTALILVVFRLLWGFIGSSTARFGQFIRSPASVVAYLRGSGDRVPAGGHSPLGGYSVIAMLVALIAQVGTGLFAVDIDGIESGPLSYLVSFDQGRIAAGVHHLSFNILQFLIVLHLLAIAFYRVRGRRLIMPMVTGRDDQLASEISETTGGGAIRALLGAGAAILFGWWISAGAPF